MSKNLLEVKELETSFRTRYGKVTAVNKVSFHIKPGETLGVVGESGCGKSVTALSIMGLVPDPPGSIDSGEILFEGENLLEKTPDDIRRIRGNDIAMIFQEPMTSLNPIFTVGDQISEAIELHQGMDRKDALEEAARLLWQVGIPDPGKRIREYPHQLSGGMRQRVMIAMGLSCHPKLLIADEPTTALDVTIQAQILDLMKNLKKKLGMAMMLITHDLGVVAEMAERVIVVYGGRVVEEGPVRSIFREPLHPYSHGLLRSMPHLNRNKKRLNTIEGSVPNLSELPKGCPFHPRCPRASELCSSMVPGALETDSGRIVRCHHPLTSPEKVAAI